MTPTDEEKKDALKQTGPNQVLQRRSCEIQAQTLGPGSGKSETEQEIEKRTSDTQTLNFPVSGQVRKPRPLLHMQTKNRALILLLAMCLFLCELKEKRQGSNGLGTRILITRIREKEGSAEPTFPVHAHDEMRVEQLAESEVERVELPRAAVIVPLYNEGMLVEPVFKQLCKIKASPGENVSQVVAVDGGSKDHTPTELRKLNDQEVDVLAIPTKGRIGLAVRRGIAQTSAKYVVVIDPLLAMHVKSYLPLIKRLDDDPQLQACTISRFAKGFEKKPWAHKLATYLTKKLWGVRIDDCFSPCTVIRGETIRQMPADVFGMSFPEGALLYLIAREMQFEELALDTILPKPWHYRSARVFE